MAKIKTFLAETFKVCFIAFGTLIIVNGYIPTIVKAVIG